MKKYWCELCGLRIQVVTENCVQCDKDAKLPSGSWHYCEARRPYVMQIIEALHDLKWWLKLLWTNPVDFPYYVVSALFRRLKLQWGFSTHIQNGKVVERKLLIGLKKVGG